MLFRRIRFSILEDLQQHKMVFISGPRQSGKTNLGNSLELDEVSKIYYNWDINKDRAILKASKLDESKKLWVLDEIHKYTRWRNWLKGIYDLHKDNHQILVTGSARLDLYSRGGDSLQGRYFHYRLHPLTLSEALQRGINQDGSLQDSIDYQKSVTTHNIDYNHKEISKTLTDMLILGGFPEPFLSGSERFAARWRLSYTKLLIREDVRDLERTQDLDQMESLYERLPDLVSNNLSINRLAKDLEVSHQTVTKWITIFERLYGCFYVLPFGDARIKALKKEKKLYLWDWGRIEDPGARLENLVAVHLLRLVHWFEDIYGEVLDLRYIKDIDGHEVDFIILKKKQPWIAIEVKSPEQPLTTGFKYLLNKIPIPYAYQLHLKSETDTRLPDIGKAKVRLMPLGKFLLGLP